MKLTEEITGEIARISALKEEPYYLYDTGTIREQCRFFREIPYPEKSVHYATMAGIHPHILALVREEGLHVFVNSVSHLRKVLRAGFRGRDIVFTASAQTVAMLREAGKKGVRVNLDSPSQLDAWEQLFPGKPAGIRCNIGDKVPAIKKWAGTFIGRESRLGFTAGELAARRGDPRVETLHLYAGTALMDTGYLLDCYRALASLTPWFPRLTALNFGGGFGIDENGSAGFPLRDYGEKVAALMEGISAGYGKRLELLLEPGRIITGESGYFVARVTDVKRRPGVSFIGLNGSTAQFPRPLFYPEEARHPLVLLRNGEVLSPGEGQNSTLYGCSTYSRDFFIRNVVLPEARTGDLVVFGHAGAYCAAAATRFLGFPTPEEHFL